MPMKYYEILVEIIEEALYNADPANTDCNLNEIYDEYNAEARLIAKAEINEIPNVAYEVFEAMFDGHYNPEKLAIAINNIRLKMFYEL